MNILSWLLIIVLTVLALPTIVSGIMWLCIMLMNILIYVIPIVVICLVIYGISRVVDAVRG